MSLNTLIPNIFYSDVRVGVNFFVNGMGFTVLYEDLKGEQPFYIIKRDGVKIYLVESAEFAKKDRPEIRIETDDIQSIFDEVNERTKVYFHPNLKGITLRPWGAKEFAMKDESDVCVIFMQW